MSLPEPEVVQRRRRWSRGRLAVILAPVAITVLLAAVVGGFIVVQSQQQAQQLEQADAVAADFFSEVATFRSDVVAEVKKVNQSSPAAIRTALLAAIEQPPVLADAELFGMENSTTYAEAEQVEADLLEPYEALSEQLAEASVALTYIREAREVLDLRITDFVSSTTLSSSFELRSSLIPAFVSAREDLSKVTVPKGQKELDSTVTGAVQYVIDQSTVLANNIDNRRNYSFTYSAQFEEAITAVEDYATQVTGDLTESVNRLEDLAR